MEAHFGNSNWLYSDSRHHIQKCMSHWPNVNFQKKNSFAVYGAGGYQMKGMLNSFSTYLISTLLHVFTMFSNENLAVKISLLSGVFFKKT